MNFESTFKSLKKMLPQGCHDSLLERIALQSSYLVFELAGESLFRPSDQALGFYWILSGGVEQVISDKVHLTSGPGTMIGLEEFLEQEQHSNCWRTTGRTEALFVDRRCFKNLAADKHGPVFLLQQMAQQLLELKDCCRGLDRNPLTQAI